MLTTRLILRLREISRSALSSSSRSTAIHLTAASACRRSTDPYSTMSTVFDSFPKPAGMLSNRYKPEDMPDLTGKVAVITGGSRGIGEAIVAALVMKGCQVHLLSATKEHADDAVKHISEVTPSASKLIKHHQVDLGSLKTVISLCQTLAKDLPRIDLLFLIAGVGVAPFGLTNDGIGNHFAINHLAGFTITDVLLPKMLETSKNKSANGDDAEKYSTRIVVESSELHRAAPSDINCETLEEFSHDMDPALLYNRSKMLQILFTRHLAQHHLPSLNSAKPILALATHPGAVATEQQKGATEAYGTILGKTLETASKVLFMTKEQGSESALWAGTGSTVVDRREEVQGRYFNEADGKVGSETSQAQDDVLAKKLWDLSVKILKEKMDYVVQM